MWRQLDARKREPFEKEAHVKLKAQYHRDREEYIRNKHDPRKPKRPQSAYFLFMGSVRAKRVKAANPHFTIGGSTKEELAVCGVKPLLATSYLSKKAAKLKAQYWEAKAQYEAELAEEED